MSGIFISFEFVQNIVNNNRQPVHHPFILYHYNNQITNENMDTGSATLLL